MTREEAIQSVIRQTIHKGINTNADLHRFIEYVSGCIIPFKRVCPDHATPFEYISDCFFERYSKLLIIACRSGSKTFSTALLNMLELIFKPRCEVASIGAIQRQAKKCYTYTQGFFKNPALTDLLLKPPTLEETILINQSTYTQLVGTISGVNSPHLQKLRADEVELMKPSVIQDMLMIPMTKNGIPSSTAMVSTRKWAHGNMQEFYQDADKKDYKVLVWCYKEISQQCSRERSGVLKKKYEVPNIYDNMKPIEIEAYDNCGTCKLLGTCRGALRDAEGYFSIDDTINEFTQLDLDTWLAQKECRRPEKKGLVYKQFDRNIHVGSYEYNPDWPCDVYLDFGTANPLAAIWIQEAPTGDVNVIDEYYATETSTEMHFERITGRNVRGDILNKDRASRMVRSYKGDPANKQFLVDLRALGMPITGALKIGIMESLGYVRVLLRNNIGEVKLHVNHKCVNLIKEFESYKYPDSVNGKNEDENPIDKNNHGLDCIRYWAIRRHLEARATKRTAAIH